MKINEWLNTNRVHHFNPKLCVCCFCCDSTCYHSPTQHISRAAQWHGGKSTRFFIKGLRYPFLTWVWNGCLPEFEGLGCKVRDWSHAALHLLKICLGINPLLLQDAFWEWCWVWVTCLGTCIVHKSIPGCSQWSQEATLKWEVLCERCEKVAASKLRCSYIFEKLL